MTVRDDKTRPKLTEQSVGRFSIVRHARLGCSLAAVLSLVIIAISSTTLAAGRSQTARGDDLQVAVDTEWAGCRHGGYFPIRIRITNAGRARNVSVMFADRGYGNERLPTVERTLTLESNATQQFALSVPLVNESSTGLIQFRTDRGTIPELNIPVTLTGQAEFGEEQPALLVIADDLTDAEMVPFSTAADFLSRPKSGGGVRGFSGGGSVSRDAHPQVIPGGTMLPESWVDYSGVDIVAISLSSLLKVPEQGRSALLKWTSQGGTLVVYDVGQLAESSQELSRLLEIDNRAAVSPRWEGAPANKRLPIGIVQDNGAVLTPKWGTASEVPAGPGQLVGKVLREGNGNDPSEPIPHATGNATTEEAKKILASNRAIWSTDKPPFQSRELLLGRVYAFSGKPFPGSALDWGWFLRDLGSSNWRWTSRMGMEHRQPTTRFAEFKIPEVGEVPAKMFLVLITLFTVAIGPLNYIILNRRKQLFLLVVTIPAMAFATSISLFLYALVADGLDVKARMRSVTFLDQRNREAVSLCRAGYYAGLPPWGGLRFSSDTLVLPVVQIEDPIVSASVNWTRAQDFPNGWLRSRTPTQYVFRTHRVERGRLEVGSKAVGNELEVSNGFPWDIRRLVVKADDGHRYYGENLRAGTTKRLRKIDPTVMTDLSELAPMACSISAVSCGDGPIWRCWNSEARCG